MRFENYLMIWNVLKYHYENVCMNGNVHAVSTLMILLLCLDDINNMRLQQNGRRFKLIFFYI